jgi:hypothetical protein
LAWKLLLPFETRRKQRISTILSGDTEFIRALALLARSQTYGAVASGGAAPTRRLKVRRSRFDVRRFKTSDIERETSNYVNSRKGAKDAKDKRRQSFLRDLGATKTSTF